MYIYYYLRYFYLHFKLLFLIPFPPLNGKQITWGSYTFIIKVQESSTAQIKDKLNEKNTFFGISLQDFVYIRGLSVN